MLLCLIAIKMYQVVGMIKDVIDMAFTQDFKNYKRELSVALAEEFSELRIRENVVYSVKIFVETVRMAVWYCVSTLLAVYRKMTTFARVNEVARSEQ